jgi:hypothetical protein
MGNPLIILAPAAAKADFNLALAMIGQGPNTLSVPVVPQSPAPTWETEPTHYTCHYASGAGQNLPLWKDAALNGVLPAGYYDDSGNLVEIDWSIENGSLISGEDALTALQAATFLDVINPPDPYDATTYINAWLASFDPALQVRPDEPL